MDREYVQHASTTYRDWAGTAAAENSAITGSGDLYQLAGLARDQWTIVGIDLVAYSHGEPSDWDVRVYAVDTIENEVASYADMKELEQRRGSLPVVDVLLHDVAFEDVMRCMKTMHIQLRSHGWETVDRVARADHPIQE